jgi:hypothetical protein
VKPHSVHLLVVSPRHLGQSSTRSGAPRSDRGVDAKLRQPKPNLATLLLQEQFEVLGVVRLLTEANVEFRLPGHHQFGLAFRALPGDASRTAP